jgi:CHAD domain-containing protein
MAKAWEVPGLAPDAPLRLCARRIIDTRFREMMSYRAGTAAGEDIEQLHAMRVSSRRLRSAMKNFRVCFDRKRFNEHDAKLREIAQGLGTVRDLDVRIAWYEGYLSTAPEEEHADVLGLIAEAREERDAARGPMLLMLEDLDHEGYEERFLGFVWEGIDDRG